MHSEDIKNLSFALRSLDPLRGEADEELKVRVRRLLEATITRQEVFDRGPPSQPDPNDDIPF